MQTVLENELIKMSFDSSNSFMEAVWLTPITTEREKYRQLLGLFLEQLQIYKPKKMLNDSRYSGYVVTPEDQDWINQHIYPHAAQAGLHRIAFLIGADLFVSVSLEQLSEDSKNNEGVDSAIKQHFFDNHQLALEWLHADK